MKERKWFLLWILIATGFCALLFNSDCPGRTSPVVKRGFLALELTGDKKRSDTELIGELGTAKKNRYLNIHVSFENCIFDYFLKIPVIFGIRRIFGVKLELSLGMFTSNWPGKQTFSHCGTQPVSAILAHKGLELFHARASKICSSIWKKRSWIKKNIFIFNKRIYIYSL